MRKSHKAARQAKLIAWWMATRPYAKATQYDHGYIGLARDVLSTLEPYDYFFSSFGLDPSELTELAVLIVAYYEDFINEVGIWKAFVLHNHERFGDYLPFFPISDDYDTDYINAEDFSFLIWQWLMILFEREKMFSPVAEPILEMGKELFTLLEDRIEDMPANDAQVDFLTFEESDSFFKIRFALQWLSERNYLFGHLGLRHLNDVRINAIFEADPKGFPDKKRDLYEYDFRLGQLYASRCLLGGLTTCEWAARILRCPPAVKAKLLAIGPRLTATFVFLRQDAHSYCFQHHPSLRELQVTKASIDLDPRPGEAFLFSVIKWGDEFWSQGICIGVEEPEENADRGLGIEIPQLLMTPEEHARWLDTANFYERKFLEVIGAQLSVFPTAKAALAAQTQIYQAIAEEILGHPGEEVPGTVSDELDPDQPVAMMYVPGQGISYCPTTPVVIDYLLHPATTPYSRNEITNTLFRYVPPFGVNYILRHFPTERLGWDGLGIDAVKDAAFLSTYFLPEEAGPPRPAITFVDRSV
jgi:Protein of unknown function (DUF3843)